MKLSKTLLAIPVASFLVAAAIASGACSASVSVSIPSDAVVAYTGTPPDGIVFGTTSCTAFDYFAFGDGYSFCDDGVWEYTTDDPTSFGGDWVVDSAEEASNSGANDSNTASDSAGSNGSSSNGGGGSSSDGGGGSSSAGGGGGSSSAGG